ncbi:MAG TPA: TonB-dependent receptor, partial [Candidatus Kapabacteria bacterium]|nr:TonB-dependent receptor [Candidatus Kapabacteria bacterium]
TQKDGDRSQTQGLASIGAISSRATLEGPLGNGSWFIGGRRTYFELVKSLIDNNPEQPIPDFNFYDVNAKITQDIGSNDKLSLSGFISKDNLMVSSFGIDMDLSIGNRLASMNWTHIFSNSLFANLNLSASHYFNNFDGDQTGYQFLIENSITDYSAKLNFEWFTNEKITHNFGLEINNYNFQFLQNFTGETDSTQVGSSAGTTNLKVKDYNYSAYAQINYSPIELFAIQAGLRGNYWQMRDIILIDPRLALRYTLTDNIALIAAWGVFSQNLRLATQPDFSFFDTWLPTDSTVPASRAIHYIFSVETKPFQNFDLNFDIYYKKYRNVSELNQNALQGSNVRDVFYIGNAYSYGFEVFLQKRVGKLTGWAGYALGYIRAKFDSINYGREFRPKYDRLHDFKVVMQYNLSEKWDIGATFTFQSGQSYTGATSRFQSFLPTQTYGRGKIVPSQRYGLRLPPSHQLNLNATYSFKSFGLDSKLIFDIYNVYNRRDIWFRYYNLQEEETKVEDVRLIPILPTISYEIKF